MTIVYRRLCSRVLRPIWSDSGPHPRATVCESMSDGIRLGGPRRPVNVSQWLPNRARGGAPHPHAPSSGGQRRPLPRAPLSRGTSPASRSRPVCHPCAWPRGISVSPRAPVADADHPADPGSSCGLLFVVQSSTFMLLPLVADGVLTGVSSVALPSCSRSPQSAAL